MRNLFLLLFSIGLQFSCNAQLIVQSSQAELAREQIINLKEKGALVVRLKAQIAAIEKLQKRGLVNQANILKKRTAVQNKQWMTAFKAAFDFCPVYFIDERGTDAIKNEDFKANIFLNDDLEIDESIPCDAAYFLTAEYGQTLILPKVEEIESERESTDYQGNKSEVEVTAFIVKDKNFEPLKRPFPFYVREYTGVVISRSEKGMARYLNRNLTNFYKSAKQ